MRILLATNNTAKVERIRKLLQSHGVECVRPTDIGLAVCETVEGSDLAENAKRKALAYVGQVALPIMGQDTALVIPGEDLDPAKVKRNALGGRDEATLKQEEIAQLILDFYRAIAVRHGGQVAAYWEDVFALVALDGSVRVERARRYITLTTEIHGQINPYTPLRSTYLVQSSGKYPAEQTPQEEAIELQPVQAALERLLGLTPSSSAAAL